METIKLKLVEKLAAKGLENNEIGLFIKDVIRIETDFPGDNLETINGQLQVLGWQDEYADYNILQLIQACYHKS